MDRKRIDQAAAQAGIAADFINAHGKRRAIEPETKRKLLAAMSRADAAQEGRHRRCRRSRCSIRARRWR